MKSLPLQDYLFKTCNFHLSTLLPYLPILLSLLQVPILIKIKLIVKKSKNGKMKILLSLPE